MTDFKILNDKTFKFIKEMNPNSGSNFNFPNLGISFARISDELKNVLLNEALRMRYERTKNNIDIRDGYNFQEYDFYHMKDHIVPVLNKLTEMHNEEFNYVKSINVNEKEMELKLTQLWVNFMQAGNYNSHHIHGGIYSFVIWLKIPYDLQKEMNKFPRANDETATINSATSCFSFFYQDVLGRQNKIIIPVDQSYEGVICLFPSTMFHNVNPFYTSNEERISVAGNLFFKNGDIDGGNNGS